MSLKCRICQDQPDGKADELIQVQRAKVQEQHDPKEAPQSLCRVHLTSIKS